MATEFHIRIRSTLDRNKFGFVNELLVYIPIPPWLSALNAIGLARQSTNRTLIHATQLISVKRGRREREKARKRALLLLPGNSIHCGRRMNEEADRLLQYQAWRGWVEVGILFCVLIGVAPFGSIRDHLSFG